MAGRGLKWERVCENSRDRLHQDGSLFWMPFAPQVLKVGKGLSTKKGSFLAIWKGKAPPDWCAITKQMFILGDDKDCKGDVWWTGNVKPHQAKHFDRFEEHGGKSCVLLRMKDRSRWVLPWKLLRPIWVNGGSISLDNIEKYGLKWKHKCVGEPNYDWLSPLQEFYNASQ
jgi:penicillin-binding protein-related factor A (putative recombinase)|tara:strand:+ start:639 stop:1148 length:510 start_codon:yes stop_codon:yes gene_type:complete